MHSFGPLLRYFVVLTVLTASVRITAAQDAVKAYPKNYQLVFENSAVSVIRVHYGPHEKVGVHDHSAYPTMYVYLSDSPPVRFTHDEQPPFTATRPPIKAGAFRVSPGRRERHSVENLGDASSDFLRVELKQVPLGGVKPFRGEAPGTLSVTEDSFPVRSPALEIERVVCASPQCPLLRASSKPSVVVAFTPMLFLNYPSGQPLGTAMKNVRTGEVQWLAAGEDATVLRHDEAPAHLLRIVIGKEAQPSTAK